MSRAVRQGTLQVLVLLALVAGALAGRAWWLPSPPPAHRAPRQAPPDRSSPLPDRARGRGEESAPPKPVTETPSGGLTDSVSEPLGSTGSEPASRATALAEALETLGGAARAERIVQAVLGDRSPEVCEVAAAQVISDLLGGSERPMSAEQRQSCCGALLQTLAPGQPLEARRPTVVAILASGSLPQIESLLVYLERLEPDARIQAWGTGAARAIRDAGGDRDAELLASLVRRLEPEGR